MKILLVHRNQQTYSSPVELIPSDKRRNNSATENMIARDYVVEYLEEQGHEVTAIWRGELSDKISDNIDLVISLGGDGTLLETSHYLILPTPRLLGLTSSDTSVGALCYGSYAELPTIFPKIVKNELSPKLTGRISVAFAHQISTLPYLLNDVLFAHKSPTGLTRMIIKTDRNGFEEEFRCNSSGIWISTCSGQTGAIKSAGNTKEISEEDVLVYMVNNPQTDIRHKKNGIADWIEITSLSNDNVVFGDGQFNTQIMEYGDTVSINANGTKLGLYRK